MVKWEDTPEHVQVSAWHDAYRNLDGAPLVGRTIRFDRHRVFVIVDWVMAHAKHDITVSYTLTGERLLELSNKSYGTAFERGNVAVRPLLQADQSLGIATTFHSPNYGVREAANRLTITQTASRTVFVSIVTVSEFTDGLMDIGDIACTVVNGVVTLDITRAGKSTNVQFESPFPWV